MTTKTEAQRDAEKREEGTEATSPEATTEATEATEETTTEAKAKDAKGAEVDDASDASDADEAAAEAAAEAELAALAKAEDDKPSGVGQGAGAIVSVALGIVGLSGGWLGTIASARAQLKGQLTTAQNASIAKQVDAMYGDAWHSAALVGGVFSLIALVIGAAVLARPAFGAPGKPQPLWIKSTAWAGLVVGVIGLLLAVAKYTDLILGMPSTG
ncbi:MULTISPECIES: hypothetical protein [unclassified Streptomyces]|uniref:hypothetical protein n=1 Tax=unclassified Streptomyces TaxID=2593676 RepID=UPI00278C8832|nr:MULTISPECIES: hypothetical protein [unclassified Streptomyces]